LAQNEIMRLAADFAITHAQRRTPWNSLRRRKQSCYWFSLKTVLNYGQKWMHKTTYKTYTYREIWCNDVIGVVN